MVLKNLRLSTKLYLGFALLLGLMAFTVRLGYLGMNNNNEIFTKYRDITKEHELTGEIETNLLLSRIAFKNMIENSGGSETNEFYTYYTKMDQAAVEFKQFTSNELRIKQINDLLVKTNEYYLGYKKVFELDTKKWDIYKNLLNKYGSQVQNNLKSIMAKAYNSKNNEMSNAAATALNHLQSGRLYVVKYLQNMDINAIKNAETEFNAFDKSLNYFQNIKLSMEISNKYGALIREKEEYYDNLTIVKSTFESEKTEINIMNKVGPEISVSINNINKNIKNELDIYGPEANANNQRSTIYMVVLLLIALMLSLAGSLWIIHSIIFPVKTVTETFGAISEGEADLTVRINRQARDEIGQMSSYFNKFMDKLQVIFMDINEQNKVKTGLGIINEKLRGEQNLSSLCSNVISYLCRFLNAQIGIIYIKNSNNSYELISSYAFDSETVEWDVQYFGMGLLSQCALEKRTILVSDVPEDYIKISSGVGEAIPQNIVLIPCIFNDDALCIVEIGSFKEFASHEIEFVEQASQSIAISVNSTLNRIKLKELLDKTLDQSEELQMQQEELRQTNEELEEQAEALKESQLLLTQKQEELRHINEELEEQALALRESEMRLQDQQSELKNANHGLKERTKLLEAQKREISENNEILRRAQAEIEEKASALEVANKYKSEFLANMSHELRTPLNSILVLSQLIASREEQSALTSKEIEFAKTIYSSGNDLLNLINDILDLSKVEAGKMDIVVESLLITDMEKFVMGTFEQIAINKGLMFTTHVEEGLCEEIKTDSLRLFQIIKNLLSNAFKFTEKGSITLSIRQPLELEIPDNKSKNQIICFSISDTGIGIPEDKQEVIFEAFKQSDGTTSRKYGGTGLGLSISREMAHLLGGRIIVKSLVGKGSTFTLIIPINYEKVKAEVIDKPNNEISENAEKQPEKVKEDIFLNEIESVIIKDEIKTPSYKILAVNKNMQMCKEIKDFFIGRDITVKSSISGLEALDFLIKDNFDCIILDFELGDIEIFQFLEEIKYSKGNAGIIIYTSKEITENESLELNRYSDSVIIYGPKAKERLLEEVNSILVGKQKNIKNLNELGNWNGEIDSSLRDRKVLIVDDDMRNVFTISNALESNGMRVVFGRNGADAIDKLKNNSDIDIILMDIMMPEMDGYTAMKKIKGKKEWSGIPIIVLTAKSMINERQKCIEAGANDYLTKPINLEKLVVLIKDLVINH